MADSHTFDELEGLFDAIQRVANAGISIAVGAEFSAQARALEYGSIANRRPWPRPGEGTLTAVDPDTGAQVVVSALAPHGFIRIHAHEFAAQLRERLGQPAEWLDASAVQQHIADALLGAAEKALEAIRSDAPRNSGGLTASLHVAE